MKDRPILFSAPMVHALLAGKKTQTRRVVKLREFGPSTTRGYDWTFRDRRALWNDVRHARLLESCPYGVPGDRLWVRETWGYRGSGWNNGTPDELDLFLHYQADDSKRTVRLPVPCGERPAGTPKFRCGNGCDKDPGGAHGDELTRYWRSWRPSIHMPRWASRLTLEVTEVRVQRLQEISENDARAEGVTPFPDDPEGDHWTDGTHRTAFEYLWCEINGWSPNAWQADPWVWAVCFKRIEAP